MQKLTNINDVYTGIPLYRYASKWLELDISC